MPHSELWRYLTSLRSPLRLQVGGCLSQPRRVHRLTAQPGRHVSCGAALCFACCALCFSVRCRTVCICTAATMCVSEDRSAACALQQSPFPFCTAMHSKLQPGQGVRHGGGAALQCSCTLHLNSLSFAPAGWARRASWRRSCCATVCSTARWRCCGACCGRGRTLTWATMISAPRCTLPRVGCCLVRKYIRKLSGKYRAVKSSWCCAASTDEALFVPRPPAAALQPRATCRPWSCSSPWARLTQRSRTGGHSPACIMSQYVLGSQ